MILKINKKVNLMYNNNKTMKLFKKMKFNKLIIKKKVKKILKVLQMMSCLKCLILQVKKNHGNLQKKLKKTKNNEIIKKKNRII